MTPKTVAIAAALVLGGVLLGMNLPSVLAQWGGVHAGTYTIASGDIDAWRINVRTGQVSKCFFRAESIVVLAAPPLCSPWTNADGDEVSSFSPGETYDLHF